MDKTGPAFPMPEIGHHTGTGCTKREFFAALAMAAMLNTDLRREEMATPVNIAKDSIKMADALLAELAKGEGA